jgi:tetratricopeptide (TPR) repeat protein
MLGVIYALKGLAKRAASMFEEALRLNPAYTEAAMNLAVTYNEQGRYQDAKDVHKRMLAARKVAPSAPKVDPYVRGKIANMHGEISLAYEEAGLIDEVIRELELALALCPTFVDLRSRLAAAYRTKGDLPAAAREFERVKRENAKLTGPRLQLGMTYYAAGRFEEAAREWREVIAMQPDNKFAKLYLALVPNGARPARKARSS